MAARSGPDPRLARARLRELMVDPARFSAEPDTIAAYVEPGSKPDNLYCVVYPRGQTDIEQVLAVARANGLAVYTPQAWGINAKRPGFIVDYKFMADIKSVDAKNLYLLLEPGVTWEQVLGELASQDVRVALPAAARSPYVLESALEREVVLPAVRFTNKQLSTFHVLLADGREYRSGSDALDNSVAHWREDGGPNISRVFTGSRNSFGLPLRGYIFLYPEPEDRKVVVRGLGSRRQACALAQKCARGEVGTEVIAMSKAKAREVACDFDELATWSVAFGLEGSPKLVAYQEKRIKELAAELKLKPVAAKAGLSEAMSQALGRPWYVPDLSFGFYTTFSRVEELSTLTELGLKGESNKRLKFLIEQGAPGLNVAYDMPTIHGLDSDHPLAHGEVGRDGVPCDSFEDMERLFEGIPLAKVSTSLVIAHPPIPSMYFALARKQGLDFTKLQGTFQNDTFCRDVAANVRVLPRRAELKLCTDVVEYCTLNVPRWYPISIVGYQIREKGCTAAQELAFTLSEGIDFVTSFLDRGLDIDSFGPRLTFMWNSHNDFFEEIAKFRAARRVWARIMKERFGAKDPRSMMVRFHTQTAGCSLTAQQPLNNIVRATIQTLAAILGGTQSLHTDAFDEGLALPTEESLKIAVRTQQILAEESGVANTVDPMGGSYYVEKLTADMEEEALDYIRRIDEMGGMLEAVEQGYVQREVARAAWRYQKDVESGKQVIVGVNKYVDEGELPLELLKITQEMEDEQKARIARLKERRDGAKMTEALEKIREAAERGENLFETTMDAVEAYATLEEVWDVYRAHYGTFKESSVLVESV